MFRTHPSDSGKNYRLAIICLLTLSVGALAVTVWIVVDFLREQEIVNELIHQLPPEAADSAETLAGELRWQFRLTILVGLNLVVTGFAVLLLWHAYRTSQESLRDIKALAGDILSSVDQAVITTDLEGIVTSINRRGVELFALASDFVGMPLHTLSQSIPLAAFLSEAQDNGSAALARDFSASQTDRVQTLRAFWQPLRNHEDEAIGNVIQLYDVTKRILIDERMRRMERYMGLGSLVAGLHHEIKNPLAALALHVQLLDEQLDDAETSEEVHGMLGVIKTEIARVGGVLESFRDFASQGQLNLSKLDLGELIDRQIKLIGPRAESQQISVQVDLPVDPLPPIMADRIRIEQVLLNVLINAIEAMSNGGTLTVRGREIDQVTGPSVRIEVLDTGAGIREDLRDRLFDPYFTTKSDGTGMGLALSDKIIRQHNGSLDFYSSTEATVFEITLPLKTTTAI